MKKERRTKVLAGLDFNGVRDFCARELVDAPNEEKKVRCDELGWRSVAVRIDDTANLGDVVAGLQAERSYYGRGPGYGERIGDKQRRIELHQVWRRIENGEWEELDEVNKRQANLDRVGCSSPLAVAGESKLQSSVRLRYDAILLRAVDLSEPRKGSGRERASRTLEATTSKSLRPPELGEALRAGIACAAPASQRAVLIVSDIPDLSEAAQQRLLDELARSKLDGCTVDLLWRPVAIALGVLSGSQGLRAKEMLAKPGSRGKGTIAVVIAGHEGVEIQRLRLRLWKGRLVPERERHGERIFWKGDWTSRCHALKGQIEETEGRSAAELLFWQTRTIERMVASEGGLHGTDANAVRDDRGRWLTIEIEQRTPYVEQFLPPEVIRLAREVECVLLYSPGGRVMTQAMKHALAKDGVAVRKVIALGEEAAAWGALEAARRLEKGEAPYLDHLPQFDLWITDFDGSKIWYPLIPADEAVEAGTTYRTREPIQLELVANTGRLKLKLRKGSEVREKPRTLQERPRIDHKVFVSAEQRPISGYATCMVESESYEPFRRQPIRIVWSDMDDSE